MTKTRGLQAPREGYKEIFCAYIRVNGKKVYPKTARCFHFFVKEKK